MRPTSSRPTGMAMVARSREPAHASRRRPGVTAAGAVLEATSANGTGDPSPDRCRPAVRAEGTRAATTSFPESFAILGHTVIGMTSRPARLAMLLALSLLGSLV